MKVTGHGRALAGVRNGSSSAAVYRRRRDQEKFDMKICLIGGGFSGGNGVAILTVGAIRAITEVYPEVEVKLIDYGREGASYGPEWTGVPLTVEVVTIRFSKKFYLSNNIAMLVMWAAVLQITRSSTLRNRLIRRNKALREILSADIVGSLAGGDSFSDIYGLPRFVYVALPQVLALLLRKKLILFPQTIGPLRGRAARAVARWILQRAALIYFRDRRGLADVEALVGTKCARGRAKFCYDLGFVVQTGRCPQGLSEGLLDRRPGNSVLVGVNVSGLLAMEEELGRNRFGLRIKYTELIRDTITFVIEKKNADVLLTPHLFGTGPECDSLACDKLYTELKDRYPRRLQLVAGNYNHSEIKYIIGQCDFFIGSRMHACIAAVSQCIPTVPIAYSDKFIGVMDTVDAGHLVADPRKMSESDILTLIDRAFEDRHAIRRQFEQKIPQVKERVLGLFHEITNSRPDTGAEAAAAAAVPDQVT
jgi:colanic acid/amylovoran biosynthesis protein WcaK/AmsJ